MKEDELLVVSSDWHVDWVSSGVDRHAELSERAHEVADYAIERKAKVFAFLGDLCDPDRGSDVARALEVIIDIETKLVEAGIETIWLAGNHDVIEDGTGRTVLSPLRSVARVIENPAVMKIAGETMLLLPFTAASNAYGASEFVTAAIKKHKKFDLVLGHLSISGMHPGEESGEMRRGRDVMLPLDLLREKATMILNGHYHHQVTEPPVFIPGSLAQLTFGEKHRPGFLQFRKNSSGGFDVEAIPLKEKRQMVTIQQSKPGGSLEEHTLIPMGAIVRIIADGPEETREKWEAQIKQIVALANPVKVLTQAGNVSMPVLAQSEVQAAGDVENIREAVAATIAEGRFEDKDTVSLLCEDFLGGAGL